MKAVQKGFTLIELMIVIAIIGILASIAIPMYGDYSSRTRAGGTAAELDGYKKAIALCAMETGSLATCNTAGAMAAAGSNPITIRATDNVLAGMTITGNGVITGTSSATTPANVNLSFVDTPTWNAGDAVMTWAMTTGAGTICDSQRGLKPGQGDCP